jgi:predicted DsbA family dithiol-disulfide isomerase
LQVDVWSDVVCPWCFIGKRRLEAALASFPERERITVVFHAFELDPQAPKVPTLTLDAMLSRKYGLPPAKVAELQARVTDAARGEGLAFALDRARPENTFDAHRLLALARVHGRQPAVKEALMSAYFEHGRRIGDAAELRSIGVAAGLPPAEVDRVVADPTAFADAVRGDEAQARQLGIRGVPFFVVDQRLAVSGAQPAEVLARALAQAWAERPPEPPSAGPTCDDDTCAVPEA